jgi:hypothetical protein
MIFTYKVKHVLHVQKYGLTKCYNGSNHLDKTSNLSGELFLLDDVRTLFVDVDAFASFLSYQNSSNSGTIPTCICVEFFLSGT